jgi:signal transduction histidine kinase
VGYDDPLAQYTGELTLSLLDRGRLVPTLGAGAGFARTYRVDAAGQHAGGGASLGVGVLRAALEYRLPFRDADTRLGISATGTLPVMKGDGAPDLAPWVLATAALSVGF